MLYPLPNICESYSFFATVIIGIITIVAVWYHSEWGELVMKGRKIADTILLCFGRLYAGNRSNRTVIAPILVI